jgi:hypothetical protein
MPRLLQLTSGRLACFVSDDTVTSLAILSSGHSLILRPGVKVRTDRKMTRRPTLTALSSSLS